MGFLAGKRAVVIGLASNRSIAWGIAQAMRREGADLAFSYQTDKLKGRVEDMASELGSSIVLPLDVADDSQIDAFFAQVGRVNVEILRLQHQFDALGGGAIVFDQKYPHVCPHLARPGRPRETLRSAAVIEALARQRPSSSGLVKLSLNG